MQKQQLTKKIQKIIYLVYRFRFLNRIQIQEMLGHKDESRINKWLAFLTEEQYVGRDYDKTIGKNRMPSVYYLKKAGIRFIKQTYNIDNAYINKLYREEVISLTTKNHSLRATDFYLILRRFAKERNAILEYYTKADLAQSEFFERIKPDAYFTFETEKGKRSSFVEIDLETESLAQIRRKMQKYSSYYQSSHWKKQTKLFPQIISVSLTQSRMETLRLEIEELFDNSDADPLLCKFSTFEHIHQYGLKEPIWSIALEKEKAKLI